MAPCRGAGRREGRRWVNQSAGFCQRGVRRDACAGGGEGDKQCIYCANTNYVCESNVRTIASVLSPL